MTSIADIATTDRMITVAPHDLVTRAAELMNKHGVGDVVVAEDHRPMGILTDRDIAVRVLGEGKEPGSTTCGDVASTDLITLTKDSRPGEAVRLMSEKAIRRLPIVDDRGELCGMVTLGDLAEQLDDQSLIADISEAPSNS